MDFSNFAERNVERQKGYNSFFVLKIVLTVGLNLSEMLKWRDSKLKTV